MLLLHFINKELHATLRYNCSINFSFALLLQQAKQAWQNAGVQKRNRKIKFTL